MLLGDDAGRAAQLFPPARAPTPGTRGPRDAHAWQKTSRALFGPARPLSPKTHAARRRARGPSGRLIARDRAPRPLPASAGPRGEAAELHERAEELSSREIRFGHEAARLLRRKRVH